MAVLKYSIMGVILDMMRLGLVRKRWHKLHPDSDTIPMNAFDFDHVSVGRHTYGELNVVDFGGECRLILGDYVSISQNVSFILNAEHYVNHVSTYPFKVKLLKQQDSESFGKGDIIVDDDVWIGYGSLIMSGVHIGQGAVIAAGSVVTKDVEPYAIIGGIPATLIKYRFDERIRNELIKTDFASLSKEIAQNHIDDLYQELESVEQLNWMLKMK